MAARLPARAVLRSRPTLAPRPLMHAVLLDHDPATRSYAAEFQFHAADRGLDVFLHTDTTCGSDEGPQPLDSSLWPEIEQTSQANLVVGISSSSRLSRTVRTRGSDVPVTVDAACDAALKLWWDTAVRSEFPQSLAANPNIVPQRHLDQLLNQLSSERNIKRTLQSLAKVADAARDASAADRGAVDEESTDCALESTLEKQKITPSAATIPNTSEERDVGSGGKSRAGNRKEPSPTHTRASRKNGVRALEPPSDSAQPMLVHDEDQNPSDSPTVREARAEALRAGVESICEQAWCAGHEASDERDDDTTCVDSLSPTLRRRGRDWSSKTLRAQFHARKLHRALLTAFARILDLPVLASIKSAIDTQTHLPSESHRQRLLRELNHLIPRVEELGNRLCRRTPEVYDSTRVTDATEPDAVPSGPARAHSGKSANKHVSSAERSPTRQSAGRGASAKGKRKNGTGKEATDAQASERSRSPTLRRKRPSALCTWSAPWLAYRRSLEVATPTDPRMESVAGMSGRSAEIMARGGWKCPHCGSCNRSGTRSCVACLCVCAFPHGNRVPRTNGKAATSLKDAVNCSLDPVQFPWIVLPPRVPVAPPFWPIPGPGPAESLSALTSGEGALLRPGALGASSNDPATVRFPFPDEHFGQAESSIHPPSQELGLPLLEPEAVAHHNTSYTATPQSHGLRQPLNAVAADTTDTQSQMFPFALDADGAQSEVSARAFDAPFNLSTALRATSLSGEAVLPTGQRQADSQGMYGPTTRTLGEDVLEASALTDLTDKASLGHAVAHRGDDSVVRDASPTWAIESPPAGSPSASVRHPASRETGNSRWSFVETQSGENERDATSSTTYPASGREDKVPANDVSELSGAHSAAFYPGLSRPGISDVPAGAPMPVPAPVPEASHVSERNALVSPPSSFDVAEPSLVFQTANALGTQAHHVSGHFTPARGERLSAATDGPHKEDPVHEVAANGVGEEALGSQHSHGLAFTPASAAVARKNGLGANEADSIDMHAQSSLQALAAASDAANGGHGAATEQMMATVSAMLMEQPNGASATGSSKEDTAGGYAMF